MWSFLPRCTQAVPLTARLFASVPPDVKTISSGEAFSRFAMISRAPSRPSFARMPGVWLNWDDATAYVSVKKGSIASTTSGAVRVAAALSK